MKTTIPDYALSEEQSHARPEAGTTDHSEKQSHGQKYPGVKTPTPCTCEDAQEVKGAARKAIDQQIGLNDPVDHVSGIAGNGMRGN